MKHGLIHAGHDVSSGGLITTVLEMAMSGDAGVKLQLPLCDAECIQSTLFAEEAGLVMEVKKSDLPEITGLLEDHQVPLQIIGK